MTKTKSMMKKTGYHKLQELLFQLRYQKIHLYWDTYILYKASLFYNNHIWERVSFFLHPLLPKDDNISSFYKFIQILENNETRILFLFNLHICIALGCVILPCYILEFI